MIIAVDGPTASGKGTIAKALAQRFGLKRLDTGALYRAVGLAVLDAGRDPGDEASAVAAARALDLGAIDEDRIRSSQAGLAASKVAQMSAVRAVLRQTQRAFAADPVGAVLDGRDIGTVICPDADVKLRDRLAGSARRGAWRSCAGVARRSALWSRAQIAGATGAIRAEGFTARASGGCAFVGYDGDGRGGCCCGGGGDRGGGAGMKLTKAGWYYVVRPCLVYGFLDLTGIEAPTSETGHLCRSHITAPAYVTLVEYIPFITLPVLGALVAIFSRKKR